ncbi:MAG: hypothetical protein JWO38_1731, partial [Gemmataceae bacterium]|nr:hypothetical protein [Gemmataceae bacterium]
MFDRTAGAWDVFLLALVKAALEPPSAPAPGGVAWQAGVTNPRPAAPNAASGVQPPKPQPLSPVNPGQPQSQTPQPQGGQAGPSQPQAQPAAQPQQQQGQPGAFKPSPLFSVPHPPSATADRLRMVHQLFVPPAPPPNPADAVASGSQMQNQQKLARDLVGDLMRAGRARPSLVKAGDYNYGWSIPPGYGQGQGGPYGVMNGGRLPPNALG